MTHSSEELIEIGNRTNSPSYKPAPMILDHGEGVRLYDLEGTEYLDFVAGIAVNALGYNHPRQVKVLKEQSERLLHVSNMFLTAEQVELMEALVSRSFADRVFLCNSGAEANEAGIKLARAYQRNVLGRQDRYEIITFAYSFHGRTYGALSATAQPKYHKGFEPMLPGFVTAKFNDLESVKEVIGDRTAAILVEPVQGEGGVMPATQEFLEGLRALCDEHDLLLIFDEVQAGMGRTGSLFAYQGYCVEPDVLNLAKGLGGGVPIGATLATQKVYDGWTRGSHATTFGGNPLVSAVAREVIAVIEEDGLCENATAMGELLQEGLRELAKSFDVIKDVRGRGLMVGAEVGAENAGDIAVKAREQGLLINTAGGHTLRFVPPLVIQKADVEDCLARLKEALTQWTLCKDSE